MAELPRCHLNYFNFVGFTPYIVCNQKPTHFHTFQKPVTDTLMLLYSSAIDISNRWQNI